MKWIISLVLLAGVLFLALGTDVLDQAAEEAAFYVRDSQAPPRVKASSLPSEKGGEFAHLLAPYGECAGDASLSVPYKEQVQATACLVNWAREREGAEPLPLNPTLNKSALEKARILRECNQFSHTPCGQNLTNVFYTAGYLSERPTTDWRVGENLAWGTGSLTAPREVVFGWLHSEGHRKTLLDPQWSEMGLASVRGKYLGQENASIWVNHFGFN